jgi:hypothetical protein
MAYRGTLRQCINAAGFNFTTNKYQHLGIYKNETGKYYSLCVLDQNFHPSKTLDLSKHRLVWQGTFQELRAFITLGQLNIFTEEIINEPKEIEQIGQQYDNNLANQLPDQNGTETE